MKPERLSLPEFVALSATLFAVIAFSMDAMLPALPEIAAELSPGNVNAAQLVLTTFVLGIGLGTLISGPVSDTLGRLPVMSVGLVLYVAAGIWAMQAATLPELLTARVAQGFAAAAPRIVVVAMVRDLFEGRRMAQVMSFVLAVFVIFPAFAPVIGTWIIWATGTWRAIFAAFVLFGVVGLLWLNLRQRETLPPEHRRPFRPSALATATVEVLSHPMVRIYILVFTLAFAQLLAFLASIQQLYADVYDRAAAFPYYFLAVGLIGAVGTLANAALVMRFGMRRLAMTAFAVQAAVSGLILIATLTGAMPGWLAFPAFFFWSATVFGMAGLTLGNLNALALQPMGHIAGLASSVVGALSAIAAAPVAAAVGLAFNGTPVPLLVCSVICSSGAAWLMSLSRRLDPEPKTGVRDGA